MYTVFYNFETNTFLLSQVDFSKDFYDNLSYGYLNREGDMLVCLIIYNIHTKQFDTSLCYWLWRSCIKLNYYKS